MPTYDYRCNACEHLFESVQMMADDMKPTKEPCPECGKKEVTKSWAGVYTRHRVRYDINT